MHGIVEGLADHAYHSAPGISSTGLKKLLQSPAHYRLPQEDTPALRFGRLVHMAILEPDRFEAEVVVKPRIDRRTKLGKQAYADFEEEVRRAGKMVITREEMGRLEGIEVAANQSQILCNMLDGAKTEVSAFWLHGKDERLNRRARADILADDVIVDLKTIDSASGEACAKAIVKYKYHLSAAWYVDIFTALGHEVKHFLWAFVESKPPYGVRFFNATDAMLKVGRIEAQQAFSVYESCCKTNSWPCYTESIEPVDLPAFYARKFEP